MVSERDRTFQDFLKRAERLGFEVNLPPRPCSIGNSVELLTTRYVRPRVVKGDCTYRALSIALDMHYEDLVSYFKLGRRSIPRFLDLRDFLEACGWSTYLVGGTRDWVFGLDLSSKRTVGRLVEQLNGRALLCTRTHLTYAEVFQSREGYEPLRGFSRSCGRTNRTSKSPPYKRFLIDSWDCSRHLVKCVFLPSCTDRTNNHNKRKPKDEKQV